MQYLMQLFVYIFPSWDYNLDYPTHRNEIADSCDFQGKFFRLILHIGICLVVVTLVFYFDAGEMRKM